MATLPIPEQRLPFLHAAPRPRSRAAASLVMIPALLFATLVSAHPHVYIEAKVDIVFDSERLSALRHSWKFDDVFSRDIVSQNDGDGDGSLSDAELESAAANSMQWVEAYGYFTRITAGSDVLAVVSPRDIKVEHADGRVTLT